MRRVDKQIPNKPVLSRKTSLRAHFEQRCSVNWITEDENERQNGVLYLEQSDSQGHISRATGCTSQRWNDIARILCVSDRTLRRRRRHELGMRVVGREFSNISDTELDNVVRQVREVTPSAGFRMVQGSLRQRGLVVQRMRVLQTIRRVFF